MAKKHHGKKRRSRRIGGMSLNSGSLVVKAAAAAAGYLLADKINGAIDSAVGPKPTGTPPVTAPMSESTKNIIMGGELGIGALLLFGKKKAGTVGLVKTVAGGVLLGAGIKRALKNFGVIAGYQNTPVIAGRRLRGYQNTPVIAGASPAQLAGARPPQMGGFRVNGPGYVPVGSGAKMGAVDPAVASMPSGASGYMRN